MGKWTEINNKDRVDTRVCVSRLFFDKPTPQHRKLHLSQYRRRRGRKINRWVFQKLKRAREHTNWLGERSTQINHHGVDGKVINSVKSLVINIYLILSVHIKKSSYCIRNEWVCTVKYPNIYRYSCAETFSTRPNSQNLTQ